jgi:hypothetical protein
LVRQLFVSILLATLAVTASAASFGTFTVVAPGPDSSTEISTIIESDYDFELLRAEFDSSGTVSAAGKGPLLLGGVIFETGPIGGTAMLVQDLPDVWHWDFTGFTKGKSFGFMWDPVVEGDPDYVATAGELTGMLVRLTTTHGVMSGTFGILPHDGTDQPGGPVPEPSTATLTLAGVVGALLLRRKK